MAGRHASAELYPPEARLGHVSARIIDTLCNAHVCLARAAGRSRPAARDHLPKEIVSDRHLEAEESYFGWEHDTRAEAPCRGNPCLLALRDSEDEPGGPLVLLKNVVVIDADRFAVNCDLQSSVGVDLRLIEGRHADETSITAKKREVVFPVERDLGEMQGSRSIHVPNFDDLIKDGPCDDPPLL